MASTVLTAALVASTLRAAPPDSASLKPTASQAMRKDMADRGVKYLCSLQKSGSLGASRPKALTALFVLACLSSGVLPDDPAYAPQVQAACQALLASGSGGFLGGDEEPSTDHALGSLAVAELVGVMRDSASNHKLYDLARAAMEQSIRLQDAGENTQYGGGWRRSPQTRANDRVLTAWFLTALRAAELDGLKVSKSQQERAAEFVLASQNMEDNAKDELGGFSVDARGLTVRTATAAGLSVLAAAGSSEPNRVEAARAWLMRHPPRWVGPQFFDAHFFAVRALYRTRSLDGGAAFRQYMAEVAKLLKERQDADGSFPFPPGHSEPLMAMGKAYSTAMAVLILNADRGLLPIDCEQK